MDYSIDNQKKNTLKKLLLHADSLAIFMHINPDPDSLASACILKRIADIFSVPASIVMNGKLGRRENELMAQILNIKLQDYKNYTSKKNTLHALLDCQPEMSNQPFSRGEDLHILIDHHLHRGKNPASAESGMRSRIVDGNFTHFDPKAATTATILLEYLLAFGSKKREKEIIHENLATAYAYALLAETHYLTREYGDRDIELYKRITPYINFKKLAIIRNVKRSKAYYNMLAKAIRSYTIEEKILYCALGHQESAHLLHLVAEAFACMEGVNAAVICMKKRGKMGRVCLRAQKTSAKLGIKLKKALAPYGSGGGHYTAAAGIFAKNVSEKKILAAIAEAFKNF